MQSPKKKSLEEIRRELKELLVVNLALEDVTPEEIGDDEILFEEGLGLDSLDAVEIVVLIQRNYGLEIIDEEQAREIGEGDLSVDEHARRMGTRTSEGLSTRLIWRR
jgi:acyl carrier protein